MNNLNTAAKCLSFFDSPDHLVHTLLQAQIDAEVDTRPFVPMIGDLDYKLNVIICAALTQDVQEVSLAEAAARSDSSLLMKLLLEENKQIEDQDKELVIWRN